MFRLLPSLLLCSLLLHLTTPFANDRPVILLLGDSLSSGYGIALSERWTTALQDRLTGQGFEHRLVNASVTGETSRGGLSRLPELLQRHRPQWVVIELGGNDGLRGLGLAQTRQNIQEMVHLSRAKGSSVLLIGMKIPPNLGPVYSRRFEAIYTDVARQGQVPLVPFLLEGVAGDSALMQTDGLHANDQGQVVILENVWTVLGPLLQSQGPYSAED
ncbi:MAG: arylesterase [endosymbiont of Seepiophila jonesi]|uniref:Arylesterase n=1 Tax=endosymbiont of Lamellibrachia luymesi TaxID=2200907 RepID=A0A370DU98_9GAMM|nr:MAG: arylesterase [endosymbiont of Lamellibrachia luymesi]RDH89022.1 MAG: arylesterase [endosymbiont of Seepiophila jonesi]